MKRDRRVTKLEIVGFLAFCLGIFIHYFIWGKKNKSKNKIYKNAISQLVGLFILPLSSFRAKAFKQLVNKDPSEVKEIRGKNNNPTIRLQTTKQKVSF